MHIDNLSEFEELVHDIKCPLLIFLTNVNCMPIDYDKININKIKKRVNVIDIDIGDNAMIMRKHGIRTLPSCIFYKDGRFLGTIPDLNKNTIDFVSYEYGVKDE